MDIGTEEEETVVVEPAEDPVVEPEPKPEPEREKDPAVARGMSEPRPDKSMNMNEAILKLDTANFRAMMKEIEKDDPVWAERLRAERKKRRDAAHVAAHPEVYKAAKRRWWGEVGTARRAQRNRESRQD